MQARAERLVDTSLRPQGPHRLYIVRLVTGDHATEVYAITADIVEPATSQIAIDTHIIARTETITETATHRAQSADRAVSQQLVKTLNLRMRAIHKRLQ